MIGEPRDPMQRQVAGWLVVAGALAFHLIGLYVPRVPGGGDLGIPYLDKLAHVILFAVPTWALLKVVPRPWMALVPLLLHVPISEWVQATWLPDRGGDVWDGVADLVGIAVGWWTTVRTDPVLDDEGS